MHTISSKLVEIMKMKSPLSRRAALRAIGGLAVACPEHLKTHLATVVPVFTAIILSGDISHENVLMSETIENMATLLNVFEKSVKVHGVEQIFLKTFSVLRSEELTLKPALFRLCHILISVHYDKFQEYSPDLVYILLKPFKNLEETIKASAGT